MDKQRTVHCKKCGNRNSEAANFCRACGTKLREICDCWLLELCVDITVSKPGQLQIILIDGAERLDKESREKLYAKCKAKGLQLIATRVTDSNVMEVTNLDDDER